MPTELEIKRMDLATLMELRLLLLKRKAETETQMWSYDETLAWIDEIADAKR